jgi:hypothetical protein
LFAGENDGKSASEDIYYPGTNVDLGFQIKAGDQKLTPTMLGDLLKKASFSKRSNIPHISIIVAFHLSCDELESYGGKRVSSKNVDLAIHFSANATFPLSNKFQKQIASLEEVTSFTIPDQMEAIILLPAGIDIFLSKENANLLRDKDKMKNILEHARLSTVTKNSSISLKICEEETELQEQKVSQKRATESASLSQQPQPQTKRLKPSVMEYLLEGESSDDEQFDDELQSENEIDS